MAKKTIQDILPLVEQPSRYLGSEINAIKKDRKQAKLRIVLAFPDLYEIGTSHFGLQILYHILNNHREVLAERVFAPATDMEAYLRSSGLPISSLESQTPLGQFDIIGFSLLYELNYTNVLTILELSEIPFFSRQRDETYPLVIGGGPCTCNPEPIAEVFDAIVVGDGEDVIAEMSLTWLEWKSGGDKDRETLLKMWSRIEGVYVPAFFKPIVDQNGFQTLIPKFPDYPSVKRAVVGDLDTTSFPDTPIVPYGKPIHDRLRIEVSRGCTRGCRFCQAGMIYRPVRERSVSNLISLSDSSIASTGYEDISLLSLSTGDYRCIVPLLEGLMVRYEPDQIAVSFPSLRAGTLTPALMSLVKRVRKTGFTIAPEAGSQRLRDVVNKNITEKEIENTVKDAFHLGWHSIKLYFMVGLPTETDDDLRAIVDLVKKLKKIKDLESKKGTIKVSMATFIPKPHTPFQWSSQISLEESKYKIQWLKKNLKIPGVQVKWQNPEVSIIEGLWARGDRRLSNMLVSAYQKGCKFDGWSDTFRYPAWKEAFYDTGIDIDFYTTRIRDKAEPLPWDHIDTRITKDFLISEMQKGIKGEITADCRYGDCMGCGVCDFEFIKPKVFEIYKKENEPLPPVAQNKQSIYRELKVSYSKLNQAKYFGHIELAKILSRAIRRAEISVKFSEGFHPKPKISFVEALPIGLESQEECFYVFVSNDVRIESIKKRLNKQLPSGLRILDCMIAPIKSDRSPLLTATYEITQKGGIFDEKELECFTKNPEFIISRTNRKGKKRKIDLKEMVLNIKVIKPDSLMLTLKTEPGKTIRPFEVIKNIFSIPEEKIKQAKIVKLGA